MMNAYASIPLKFAIHSASLKECDYLEAMINDDLLWIRYKQDRKDIHTKLKEVPYARLYRSHPKGIIEENKLIPDPIVPEGNWQALRNYFELNFSINSTKSQVYDKVELKLVRSSDFNETNFIACQFKDFHDFVIKAAQVRFRGLKFCVDKSGFCYVYGKPAPAIKSKGFYIHQQIAIPIGFRLEPNIPAKILKRLQHLNSNEYLIFDGNRIERLNTAHFKVVTRRTVRLYMASIEEKNAI